MNIQEMHVLFRTLGQQMGMQKIRAILPESIDNYLNDSIVEKVRNTVLANVNTVYQDKVAMRDNFISPINALRTLYKEAYLPVPNSINPYRVSIGDIDSMFYTSFSVDYTTKRHIKCRFVEGDKLEDTINDYCNRAFWDAPIVSLFADENGKEVIHIFNGDSSKEIDKLIVRYIENPKTVVWSNDLSLAVDCNLPNYLHNEIVEMAVNKYFQSVGSTTQSVD